MKRYQKESVFFAALIIVLLLYLVVGPLLYQNCDQGYQDHTYEIFQNVYIALSLFILITGLFVYSFWQHRVSTWLIPIILILFCAFLFLVGLSSPRISARDGRRAQDLKEIENTLELYNVQYGSYPETIDGIENLPRDPSTRATYDYAHSPDKQSYVLRAIMESASGCDQASRFSKSLLKDPNETDGLIYGLNCNDPAYCISR